jgi:CRP-like cAMP-binding protein
VSIGLGYQVGVGGARLAVADRQKIALARNDILGEIAIFGEVPRTATAKATTRLETLKISKDLFIKIIRENPDAAIELIRILASRLANTTNQLTRTRSGAG